MEKIELLKKIIDDQAILINKLQGYLVSDLKQTPKKIIKTTSRQINDRGTEETHHMRMKHVATAIRSVQSPTLM